MAKNLIYDLFASFRNDNFKTNNQEARAMQEDLRKFKSYAFLLQDPSQTEGLDYKFGTAVKEVSYHNRNLLLYPLVNQELSIPKQLKNSKLGLIFENTLSTEDSEATSFSLTNFLGIPLDFLPCIILTDNFNSNKIICIKVNPKANERYLGQQLTNLEELTARSIWHNQNGIWENDNVKELALPHSTAFVLSDFLASVVRNNDLAISHRNSVIKREIEYFRYLQENIKNTEEIEKQAIRTNSYLAESQNGGVQSPIDYQWLNNYSKKLIKSGLKAYKYFESQFDENEDFTPLAMNFAKVYEHEFNVSLVKWYNNSYSSSVDKIGVVAKNFKDKIGSSRSIPPPYPRPWQTERSIFASFIDNWILLNRKRNTIAHAGEGEDLISKRDVDDFIGELKKLNDDRSFKKICELKQDNGTYRP
jgi:hypothetical protein